MTIPTRPPSTDVARGEPDASKLPRPPAHLVQSADHALRLLRAVVGKGSLRVADAAQILEVVPSTAHRLLATLGHQGFVVQERRGGAYTPGPAVAELAGASRGGIDLRTAARPILEWLREQTKETVSLLVLEQAEIRFLDSIDGTRSVRVSSRLGLSLPAHCTSGGKALLAVLSRDDLVGRYPLDALTTRSGRSISTRERLEVELEDIRRRGYATNFDEGDAGIGGVSVTVRTPDGDGAVAAISLAAPIGRLRTRKAAAALAPMLQYAAGQLEGALTGHPWTRPTETEARSS